MCSNVNISYMREVIQKQYPGKKWEKQVKDMSDGQVIAIYYSMKKRGQIK